MSEPALPEATYADLEALPPHVTGQLVDGTLYAHARPASPYALASSVLGGELGGAFHRGRGGPGGWLILDEPELRLELAVYKREGVAHLWFVDPEGRTLEVLRREDERYVLAATFEGDGGVRAEPFDALELELGALWRG